MCNVGMSAPFAGAVIMTFLAPAWRCFPAPGPSTKTPVPCKMMLTFLTPPLSLTTTTSRGESLRPCQHLRKFLPILPNPLMATFSLATVSPLAGAAAIACCPVNRSELGSHCIEEG